jgi:multiple sugar transport system substrate-binding protein
MTRDLNKGNRRTAVLAACAILVLWAGRAGAGEELVFWHTQAQANARLLHEIVDDYNAANPPMPVSLRYVGGYTELFRKVRATVATNKRPPDLVVAYESMVAEYIELGAAVALDPYIEDAEVGLSKESLADIFPSILTGNRYPSYGNKYYTFPFTKSVLMMYYNRDLLREAGYDGSPPKTWEEFHTMCLAMKKLGKEGYALSVDASTVDGMVMSFGGQVLDPLRKEALFDRPPAVATFRLLHNMARTGACYQIDRRSYGDRKDFAGQLCAFLIRSSTTRPYLERDIEGRFDWDMTIIPQGTLEKAKQDPVTVLFGANVAVLRTTPERQRAAWQFVKYFVSRDVTARWSLGTGYLPVRRSAAETDAVKAFFAKSPRNRRAFDALPYARTEPGVSGWQAVRTRIELAESDAVRTHLSPEQIAERLNREANAALAGGGLEPGSPSPFLVAVASLVAVGVLASLVRKRKGVLSR